MEPTLQEPYQDSPASTRPSTPDSHSSKPLPTTPDQTSNLTPDESYRDEPTVVSLEGAVEPSIPQQRERRRWNITTHVRQLPWPWVQYASRRNNTPNPPQPSPQPIWPPYTDTEPNALSTPTSDEDVPLAYLYNAPNTHINLNLIPPPHYTYDGANAHAYSQSYPAEAPPSYTAAVLASYHAHPRATLIQFVPESPIYSDRDVEAGLDDDDEAPDAIRHTFEKLYTAFTLLFIWFAIGVFVMGTTWFVKEITRFPG